MCFYYVDYVLFHSPHAIIGSLYVAVNLSVIDEVSWFISSIQYKYRNTRWILLKTEQIALIVGSAAFVIFLGFTLFLYNLFQFILTVWRSIRFYSKVCHVHFKPMHLNAFESIYRPRIKIRERWRIWRSYIDSRRFFMATNEYGSSAEDRLVWSLVQLSKSGRNSIFRNRRIPVMLDSLKGKTSEIDVIWWHGGTLYSIEVKNWAGVLEYKSDKEWVRTLSDGARMHCIRSPSLYHVMKTQNLQKFLESHDVHVPVVPLVVFVNSRCTIDNRILEDGVSLNWDGWLSFLKDISSDSSTSPGDIQSLLLECKGWDSVVLRSGERLKGDIFGIKMYDTIVGRRFIPNKSYLTIDWRKGMTSTFLDFVLMGWPLGYIKMRTFLKVPVDPNGSIRFQPVGSKTYIDIGLLEVMECTAS